MISTIQKKESAMVAPVPAKRGRKPAATTAPVTG
ncbi:IclR family transcriptional regulator, partial [Salmonella enterica subsp. enterica serovar Newport]